jgi:hypothetical protein
VPEACATLVAFNLGNLLRRASLSLKDSLAAAQIISHVKCGHAFHELVPWQ